MDDIESKIKESAPPPKPKKQQQPGHKKTSSISKATLPAQVKKEQPKPAPVPENKSKPFEAAKKPFDNKPKVNTTNDKIVDEVPNNFEHKRKEEEPEPKPIPQSTKPFAIGSKAKPAFGKPFGKPFGVGGTSAVDPAPAESVNNSVNNSRISSTNEEPKPAAPVSFTEKYGIAKKEEPTPVAPAENPSSRRPISNAPWMQNKPNVASANDEYIPTIDTKQNLPRRVGPTIGSNTSAIPTLKDEKADQVDSIPVIGSNRTNNRLNFGSNQSNNSQIGRIPIGGNDQIDSMPTLNDRKRDQFDSIPTLNDKKRDQVDSIPTLNDKKRDQVDYIPTIGGKADPVDNIPTLGGNSASRRRIGETKEPAGGYMPSTISQPKQEEVLPGGRRRVADPFAKKESDDPLKNFNKPINFGGNNASNVSSISNNNSVFQNNK